MFDAETLIQLFGHQRLAVTNAHDLAARDPLDLGGVSIGDFAAPHDGSFKHGFGVCDSFQNNAARLRWSAPFGSSPDDSSASRWCTGSFSRKRASISD